MSAIYRRLILSSLRNDWGETVLWRILTVVTICLSLCMLLAWYFKAIPLETVIFLSLFYIPFSLIGIRNWKFHKRKDGTLIVPLE